MNRGMRVLQTLALPLGYVTKALCPRDIIQYQMTIVKGKEKFPQDKICGSHPQGRRPACSFLRVNIDELSPQLGIEDGLTAV